MANKKLDVINGIKNDCPSCSEKKETNHWSSDGWDRMVDWVCKKNNNALIASSVEWHEERKIQTPSWCPILKVNQPEITSCFVLSVTVSVSPKREDIKRTKVYSSSSQALEALVELFKQLDAENTLSNKDITSFKMFNEYLEKCSEKVVLSYQLEQQYFNEMLAYDKNYKGFIKPYNSVVEYYSK